MRRALLLALAATLALPAGASAATTDGKATIVVGGPAANALRAGGVALAGFAPASATRSRITLPVTRGTVAASAELVHGGSLRLRRRAGGKVRTVTLRAIRLRLGRSSSLSAAVGSARRTLFTVSPPAGRLRLDSRAATASLRAGRLTLTRSGAALLARRLGLRRLPAARFGLLALDASVGKAPPATSPGGGGGSNPGGSGPGDGPKTEPLPPEPPVLARPAGADSIVSATITWHPRPSFVQYINSGEGTRVFDGATNAPKSKEAGSDAELVYSFHYPFRDGWLDRASGVAGVYFTGGVNFSYADHGIDLDAKEPEIELNGTASRAIFRFDGRRNTKPGNRRGVLVDLHLDQAKSHTVSPDGKTVTWEEIPGTIPQGTGSSIFAGFYQPGDDFGWISVTFATA